MSKWYSLKEFKRARTPMLLDSVTGLPDNHVITVVERVISVDDPELIQNNVRTDTFTLNLDAEYDDLNVVVIFTKPNNINVKVAYNGTPTHIPGSAMELVGSLACSVVGIDADGEVRAVTKAAPDTFQVVKSGAYDGSVTSDDVELLGQILQAVSDAEAAITEAETATTAATNATNQATSAATSANKAASSANSAASSANSAATKANSAAVNAENAYETLQPYMATIDSCANILHREVGPDSVVTADDSFPCKPVEMVVHGNTVQNLWVNPSGTRGGVTVTSNEDGSMTISGTNSTSNDVYIHSDTITAIPYGKQLTVSSSNYGESGKWRLLLAGIGGGTVTEQETFLAEENPANSGRVLVVITPGTTVNATVRVMLNEGSTAEPWCPPGLNSVGDDGSVDIVTAGKNIVDVHDRTISSPGYVAWNQALGHFCQPGKYVASFDFSGTEGQAAQISLRHIYNNGVRTTPSTLTKYVSNGRNEFSLPEVDSTWNAIDFFTNSIGTYSNFQLELGSTATAYEPPNITITTIDLQGHTLNALPDGTRDELHIDGGGNVVLEKRTGIYAYDGTETFNAIDNPYWAGVVATTLRGVNSFRDAVSQDRTYCDKLPPVSSAVMKAGTSNGILFVDSEFTGTNNNVAYRVLSTSNPEYVKELMTGGKVIYKLAEPQTIDLGTITPPTMAAPNVTAYVVDDTPAEMELDYVRDINIVVDRLEKKVADLVVTEATIV